MTPSKDFVISVKLPRLALLPGCYTIYLYAVANGEVVDWLLPGGLLNVEPGDFYCSGIIPEFRDAVFLSDYSVEITSLVEA